MARRRGGAAESVADHLAVRAEQRELVPLHPPSAVQHGAAVRAADRAAVCVAVCAAVRAAVRAAVCAAVVASCRSRLPTGGPPTSIAAAAISAAARLGGSETDAVASTTRACVLTQRRPIRPHVVCVDSITPADLVRFVTPADPVGSGCTARGRGTAAPLGCARHVLLARRAREALPRWRSSQSAVL